MTRPFNRSVWLGGSLLILASALIAVLMPQQGFLNKGAGPAAQSELQELEHGEASEIGWKLLQTLDYKKDVVPEELQARLNKKVKIPGFAVPLSSDYQAIDEFLFVPNQLACIHVPAPPPHLVIMVKLRKATGMNELSGPLWLSGILALKHSASVYGAAAYELDALEVKPYIY